MVCGVRLDREGAYMELKEKRMGLIPFTNLKAQYQSIKPEIDAAIQRVFESSQFILGKEVANFEASFARYCKVEHAIGVNSGTSALHLALLAAGVGSGDEVITVPFTFVATVSAIQYTGAKPVFVDVEPKSLTIDVTQIEKAITPKTKAIIPVHLFGQPADIDSILALAKNKGLKVIEDAAQAHGAQYKGKPVGGFGDLGCFSFYAGKNLGACGEGGAVTTNCAEMAEKIRQLRNWGSQKKYVYQIQGYNYRLEGIQGAILGVKLKHLDKWNQARQKNAQTYNEFFKGSGIVTPTVMSYGTHVYHVYAIRTPSRDQIHQALNEQEVQSLIHYPIPLHLQPSLVDLGYGEGDFPVAEKAAKEVLSLPIYPELKKEEMEKISNIVLEKGR